jgi:hypothetical protein
MEHLQHTSEISEALKTYACNMHFQAQHLLAAWTKMKACQCRVRCRCGARCHGVKRSSPMWSSSPVGGTVLDRGRDRRMERDRYERRESGQGARLGHRQGHAVRAGWRGRGRGPSPSRGTQSERAIKAEPVPRVGVRNAKSERVHPSIRHPIRSITVWVKLVDTCKSAYIINGGFVVKS